MWLSFESKYITSSYLQRVSPKEMESAELVEMYRTLLPIARVDFGKEVSIYCEPWIQWPHRIVKQIGLLHQNFHVINCADWNSIQWIMQNISGEKYKWQNSANFGFARAGT